MSANPKSPSEVGENGAARPQDGAIAGERRPVVGGGERQPPERQRADVLSARSAK